MYKTTVSQQSNTESLLPLSHGILQHKCACAKHTGIGGVCAGCAKKTLGLQRKIAIGASYDPLEWESDRAVDQVMAMPTNRNMSLAAQSNKRLTNQTFDRIDTAPAIVDQVLASSGRPMQPKLRQDMEQRFGHDFSSVRVHTDTQASNSARAINAQAYTVGRDVVFGQGNYSSQTNTGRKLLAHELTHVVQQQGIKGPDNQTKITVSQSTDATELEADVIANQVVSGEAQRESNKINQFEAGQNSDLKPVNVKQSISSTQLSGKWIVDDPSTVQVSGGAKNENLLKDAFSDICNTTRLVSRGGNKRLELTSATSAPNRTEGCGCLQIIETDVNNFLGRRPSFLKSIPRIGVDVNGWSFTDPSPTSPEVRVRHPEDPFGWGYWSGADQRKQKDFFRTVAHEVCGHMSAEVQGSASGRVSTRGHNEAIIRENRVAAEHGVPASDQRGLDKSEGAITAGTHRGESFLKTQIFFDHDSDLASNPAEVTRVVNGVTGTIQFFERSLGTDRIRVQLEGFGLSNESNSIIQQRITSMKSELALAFGVQSIAEPFPDPDNPGRNISRFARDILTQVTGVSAPNTSDSNRRVDIFLFHKSHSAR